MPDSPDSPNRQAELLVRTAGPDEATRRAAIAELAPLLRDGRLVAFPTETVYGLGANALDRNAVAKVFAAKGRPSVHPLIVHIATIDDLRTVTREQTDLAHRLAKAFWPGPLTLVLPKADVVPDLVSAGLDTVGVRIPANPIARELIAAAGVPVAAPSANPFTRISPTTAQHVIEHLGDRIDAVLDGGPTDVGIESTVVDATGERPVLLRPGGVSESQIEAVAGPVDRPAKVASESTPRPSPGTSIRHYSPRASVVEVTRDPHGKLDLPDAPQGPWGVLTFATPPEGATVAVEMPRDPAGYAQKLFAALHEVDAARCVTVFIERLPTERDWDAVADRLRRAGLPRNPSDS